MKLTHLVLAGLVVSRLASGQSVEPSSNEPGLEKFKPLKAPKANGLLLKRGDRLAICGDSITEQKMYSRIIEDYLTMCLPELGVSVRQYGWSGERAPGFLARMTNDCLRFKPTVATTCYGMNDHEYKPYEPRIGETYRQSSTAIVEAFKAHKVRVVQGSPGCVGKLPSWVKTANGGVDDLNLSLCNLRNIGIEIAKEERVRFADVFWPMLTAGVSGQKQYGPQYAIAGSDGVHPGWAGQTVMAYAFLKAFDSDGQIGAFALDARSQKLKTSKGHQLISSKNGSYEIKSSRYPFCACFSPAQGKAAYPGCEDDLSKDSSIRSAMTLIPFNQELNRLMLVVRRAQPGDYKVTWGAQSKTFSHQQLAHGVNLAEAFPINPFSDAFAKVDAAIAAKQVFETKQIKEMFRSSEAKTDMEAVAAKSEQEHQKLVDAIHAAFVPVTHTLKIEAL